MTRNFYTLDGIPLHDPQGRWTLGDGAEIRSVPARRKSAYALPGRDGEIVNFSPSFDPGKLAFSIHILTSDNHDTAMKTLEFWNGILGQRGRLLPLDHYYNGEIRRAFVQITASTETSNFIMRAITINVICDIPGTFWRDVNPSVSEVPMYNEQVLSGLNGGTGPISDAVIKYTGPLTKIDINSIADPSNVISISTSVSASNELIVDTANWKAFVRPKTASWAVSGTPVEISASKGFGSLFILEPSFNSTTLTTSYSVNIVGHGRLADSKVLVRARRSFL